MKEMINCRIPLIFPLKSNDNGIRFTEESLNHLENDLKNAPIVKDGNVVGILTDSLNAFKGEEQITVFVDGKLFTECLPEIIIKDSEIIDGVTVVKDFTFSAISL